MTKPSDPPTPAASPAADTAGVVPQRRYVGKVVIVTGGGGGIGIECVARFGREGARVVVVNRTPESSEMGLAAALAAGAPDGWAATADVAREEQVVETVAETLRRFGRLDAIVNNAGLMNFKPIEELTGDDWRQVLDVDLLGAFYFLREGFRHMARGGAIVNVSSVHALRTTALVAPYAAAKAAMLSLTRSAAIEGRPKGLRVNSVAPGAIDTPMLWDNPNVKSGDEKIDIADVGKAEDIAAVIAYLASDDAKFVQGAALRVDGGRLNQL